MNTALLLCGFVGFVMLVVGLAMIVPELAIDSPLDLLISLVSRRADHSFFWLVHAHIQEGWPETRVAAFFYYGGLVFIGVAGLVFGLREYFSEMS
jgi:uncharacterized membrane protein